MKKAMILAAALSLCVAAAAKGGGGGHSSGGGLHSGSHSVSGYTRHDGTHVAPSHATNPNQTKLDNWSTKGNVNPYTGKEGTRKP